MKEAERYSGVSMRPHPLYLTPPATDIVLHVLSRQVHEVGHTIFCCLEIHKAHRVAKLLQVHVPPALTSVASAEEILPTRVAPINSTHASLANPGCNHGLQGVCTLHKSVQ